MKGKKKEEYPWNTDPHNSRCLQTGEGPKKGHEDDQSTAELSLWWKTEGVRPFLHGEQKYKSGLHHSLLALKGIEGRAPLHKESPGAHMGQ